jgi:hypothetical protein
MSVSRLAYRYSTQWDTKIALKAQNHQIESVEYRIQRQGFSHPLFRQAVGVTSELLKQFKTEVGDTPLIFMLVDDIEPYSAAIKGIARGLSTPLFIPLHNNALPPSERLADGAHLNSVGNKTLGQLFLKKGIDRGVF